MPCPPSFPVAGVVEMECGVMIDMIRQHVVPSVKAAQTGPLDALHESVHTLESALAAIHVEPDLSTKAALCRTLRLETMLSVRAVCDAAEAVVPASLWTLATYKELLFMDQHHTR